ncbi:MAG: AAA family ATPase [Clostridiales bacterium]|nr:AAA family ATPase [Clostridiales bacterium]
MKILVNDIVEFAGLKNKSFTLGEGMNIIEGLNESGKSTILGFIKFVLYGFSRRAPGEELDERERYLSWTGRRAAGSITVSARGKLWRVEREGIMQTTRGGRESYVENTVKIIDAETGAEEKTDLCPGEFLLGIPAAVFSSTCHVAQSNLGGIDSEKVGSSIENLLFSADEKINAERAADILERARRSLLYKNERGGLIFDLRAERNSLHNRLTQAAAAARDIVRKEALAGEYQRQAEEIKKELEELEAAWENSEVVHVLDKFDALRRLEGRVDELEQTRRELEADSFPGGLCPDRQYAARLETLSRELTAAEGSLMRAEAELLKLEAAVPYDEEKLKIAEYLTKNAAGGVEGALCSYRMLKKSAASPKTAGLLLLILGGVAAAAALPAIFASLVTAGIIAAAAGSAALAGGIFALTLSTKRRRALSDYLALLGMSTDPGEDKLTEHLKGCFEAAESARQYGIALEARRGVVEVCQKKLTELREDCRAELTKLGFEDGENLTSALSEAAGLVSKFCAARESLEIKIENLKSEIISSREYLMKFDEAALRRRAETLPEVEPMTSEEYKRRRAELMLAQKAAEDKKNEIERQLIALEHTTENPRRLTLQLEQLTNRLSEAELQYDAIRLAEEALAEATGQLRRWVTPKLKSKAGELLGKLTGGKYKDIGVGEDLSVTINAGGFTRPLAVMSGGTKDTAYISLRLALTSLLCPDGAPLLIDEGLSQLDDVRAANLISMLLSWCEEQGGQCLIFTCHRRESELAGNRAKHIVI